MPSRKHPHYSSGDKVRAGDVSPKAEVKPGNVYKVVSHDYDDYVGYIRLEGISERYRPYLFSPVPTMKHHQER